jgi:hypothetical protein
MANNDGGESILYMEGKQERHHVYHMYILDQMGKTVPLYQH